jgi:hypothetical protein
MSRSENRRRRTLLGGLYSASGKPTEGGWAGADVALKEANPVMKENKEKPALFRETAQLWLE